MSSKNELVVVCGGGGFIGGHLIADLRPATKQEVVKGPHDRNYLVNAGPGSGKTHLLEARVAFHVHASLRPEQVMLLAFNRDAKDEIRARLSAHVKEELVLQFCELGGGPCRRSGPGMREAHDGMEIRRADFNALVEVLQDAMAAQGIPWSAQTRMLARLAPMHREIVNQH